MIFVTATNAHFWQLKKRQDKLPTMYWLPKLHRIKQVSLQTLALALLQNCLNLLISCFTAVKSYAIRYNEKGYERSRKNMFWSIKNPAMYVIHTEKC